jgi:pseudaminic acid cytidylyltransferase
MNIAIIPARGGSKRIFKKNIKNFCGKPLIAYSIEAAKKSELFEKIIVSTEDEEIAKVAYSFGAIIHNRPRELADDFTGTTPVVSQALSKMDLNGVEGVCCIYATAPFLKIEYLKEGYKKMLTCKDGYVFGATTFAYPIQRALKRSQDGVEMFYPEYENNRSQDLQEAFHDAGQFYWARPKTWLEKRSMFTKKSKMVVLPRYLVQDIDTLEDWKRAELMYKVLQNENFISS